MTVQNRFCIIKINDYICDSTFNRHRLGKVAAKIILIAFAICSNQNETSETSFAMSGGTSCRCPCLTWA